MTHIVLFNRDLRVYDHPALSTAARSGQPVVPLFVSDPALMGRSPNRDRFLAECLVDLDRSLAQLGGALVRRHGDPVDVTARLARTIGATAVHVSADVSGYARAREVRLREALRANGTALVVHPGVTVVAPGDVAPAGRAIYSVFTPFFRAWAEVPRRSADPVPAWLDMAAGVESDRRTPPSAVAADSSDLPPGGESAARRRLDAYLDGEVQRYGGSRDDLAANATSRLSAYLRFGCVSAGEVVVRAEQVPGTGELIRQIAWRDFYAHLLSHDPRIQWHNHRAPAGDTPAVFGDAQSLMDRWQHGRTGLPLVDAAMRQLRREGWMHNRARMVAASFLTRRLGIPWQEGAAHFMRWLVDGDPASNAGGWQWAAGTGTDPRRSRSFNPVRQAHRFDPDGAYVRRYVEELSGTPTPQIFAPWEDPAVLRATGYPAPILEVPTGGISRSADKPVTLFESS